MSQIMATKSKQSVLIQDIVSPKKKFGKNSSANAARCFVCGKGLEDGFSVTAKSMHNETVFFCETHYR